MFEEAGKRTEKKYTHYNQKRSTHKNTDGSRVSSKII